MSMTKTYMELFAFYQQEGIASGEFDFDGYTLDNIPV